MRPEVSALLAGKAWPEVWARRRLDALTLAVELQAHGNDLLILCAKSMYATTPLQQLRCLYHWLNEYDYHGAHGSIQFYQRRNTAALERAKETLVKIHNKQHLMSAFMIFDRKSETVNSRVGHSCKICRRLKIDLTLRVPENSND